ncbi:MAG: hypothetical protein V4719_29090, partial [Planctomycetota bacterium]
MYKLILVAPGLNRLTVISKVASRLNIDRLAAKKLVDTPGAAIGYGDYHQIAELLDIYGDLGADLDYEYWTEGMHAESWASCISADGISCSGCGHALFFNVPGPTTAEQIATVAESSHPVFGHAGVYCPGGGVSVTGNLG